jgi:hypothetical protein
MRRHTVQLKVPIKNLGNSKQKENKNNVQMSRIVSVTIFCITFKRFFQSQGGINRMIQSQLSFGLILIANNDD